MKEIPAEIVLHNQVQSLQQLYIMLVQSLNPIVVGRDGETTPSGITGAAKAAVEVALIDVCNRISQLMTDQARWKIENIDRMERILDEDAEERVQQMLQAVVFHTQPKQKRKGRSNDEQQQ